MATKGKPAPRSPGMESIDKQVSTYMRGSEFGDSQIKEMMTRELRQRLIEAEAEGRPLRVYCGYDVTAPDLHLGHTITMHKLRQFQDFGHDVTFLIGTFTTLIGDPSDRDEARAMALEEQVKNNAESYAEQAFKILDRKKTSVRYNYDWLSKLTFADVISMASYFTVQQFLVRDRLRNRYEKNEPIWLRELLYPLAQGYDAVSLQADVQIGATEQLFNLMAGRRLQEVFGQRPQVCITFPVLVGTDGVERMSKSRGNYIGIAEAPEDIYGKTMSIPDGIIMQYFELLTDVPDKELKEFKRQLDSGANPMSIKKRLARELVAQYYGEKEAQQAAEHFEKTVQKKELPDEIEEKHISFKKMRNPDGSWNFRRLLTTIGLANSSSEADRLHKQGAVEIDSIKVIPRQSYQIIRQPMTSHIGEHHGKHGDRIIVTHSDMRAKSISKDIVSGSRLTRSDKSISRDHIIGRSTRSDRSIKKSVHIGITQKSSKTSKHEQLRDGSIIKVGKRRFVKVINTDKR